MTRSLYRGLVWLHPRAFRAEFAEEMIWIYDEASGDGVLPLFADGVLSLMRQWLIRSGVWKPAVAGIGGFLYIAIGLNGLFNP
jgi:hypothetical protein